MKNNIDTGLYIRVSSQMQVDSGHSLEWQQTILKEYATNHKFNVIDIYVEEGISGDTIEKRPQLKRLLSDIESGRINNVLVYKIDRLGRDQFVNAVICKTLIDNKCVLTSSDSGVMNLDMAFGSFIYNILSAVAQYEVKTLSERIINGKKQRTRNGLYINSNSVYGYDAYCDYSGTRLLKINTFEAQIIKEIFKSYLNGISMNSIAQNLNDRKIPCKRGGNWCQSTINQILNNKLYIGIVSYNGNAKNDKFECKGKHKPIINKKMFLNTQELLKSKYKKRIKKAPNEYSYFSPILFSSIDNYSFKPKQVKAQDKSSVRYYCNNKNSNIPSIKHMELEKIFAKELEKISLNYNEKVIKEMFKNPDMDIIVNLINKTEKEQNKLFELLSNNVINDDTFNSRMNILNIRKQELNQKLEKLKTKIIEYNDKVKSQVCCLLNRNLMINFTDLKPIDKKNFINLFVDKIIIDEFHNIDIKWKRQ